jgi:hypothetical protein
MSEALSRLRQRLWRAYRALGDVLRLLARQQPMVQGSLYLLRRKCGKPGCHCARGEAHTTWVLSRSESGRTRILSVPSEQRGQLRDLTREYRLWQRGRAQLVKRFAALLELIDEIGHRRLRPWPPDDRHGRGTA